MRLSQAKEAFLKSLQGNKSKATIAAYDSDLTRFIGYVVANSVLAFTPDRVQDYFNLLASEGLKRATLHRKMSAIRMFARFGLIHGLWTADPTARLPRIPKPKRMPRPFSDDELAALMGLPLEPREKVIRALLIYTGLRVSPLCAIKLGDIDYAPPRIRALVKGAKIQVVKMHPGLAELVKAYAVAHTDLKGQSFLLGRHPGHQPRRRDVERMTDRWGVAAGVVNCTPHRFRHTFATRLLRETGNLRLVQQALAHESIEDTALYTLVTGGQEAEAIGGLDFGGLT